MENIISVVKDAQTYAILIRGKIEVDGVRFLTQQTDEFQLGVMERPAGYEVKPHLHPERSVTVRGTAEFLYIEKGVVRVTVYDEAWVTLQEEDLHSGDFLLFLQRRIVRLVMSHPIVPVSSDNPTKHSRMSWRSFSWTIRVNGLRIMARQDSALVLRKVCCCNGVFSMAIPTKKSLSRKCSRGWG